MLELEKFGVVEMSSQEQIEVEGGVLPWIILIAVALLLVGDSTPP